jgi:hypothetical protein
MRACRIFPTNSTCGKLKLDYEPVCHLADEEEEQPPE